MEGFTDGIPLIVAVSWLKTPAGAFQEVPLLDGRSYPGGLLAYTADSVGVITRWFVPWTSVVYIKQTQAAPVVGVTPDPPTPPQKPTPADPPGPHLR